MWKKILLVALSATFSASVALANVVTGSQQEGELKLSYPLVYVDNGSAQNAINTDIASYVEKAKAEYRAGKFDKIKQSYKVMYEDDALLSVVLTTWYYHNGAVHGNFREDGLVYNKTTGQRLPLSYFVKVRDANQLTEGIKNGTLKLYDENLKQTLPFDSKFYDVSYVSQSYFLKGHGLVYLIYQPYELSYFAAGATKIEFTPKVISNFNQL